MKRRQRQNQSEAELRQQLQPAQTSGSAATAANDSVSKKNRKKLVVIFMCLLVCSILLFALSRMKYTTPEMRGKAAYEPALFNTVLLGNLVEEDVKKLCPITTENYTAADSVTPGQTVTYAVTGEKISDSLNVNWNTELGNKQQANGDFSKVSPGSTSNAYIPFTVTNGTTVADKKITSTDAEGNTQTYEQKKNVAQSDICYKIHIITSGNLPLTYQLYDVDEKKTYNLVKVDSTSATMGDSEDYVVADHSGGKNDNVFQNGSRILKCNGDNSITVHQYKVLVQWPTTTRDKDGNQIANNDLKYMKELENVEIRLEVESYVNYIAKTADTEDNAAEGILVLQGSAVQNKYYKVSGTKANNIFAEKTVRYDNLRTATDLTENQKSAMNLSDNTSPLSYTFHICNGDSIAAQWTQDTGDEISATRKNNGHDDKDGHYTYSGTFQSGTYGVAIAVPTANNAKVSKTNRSNATYYLKYGDKIYTGRIATDSTVTTDRWEKKAENETTDTETTEKKTTDSYKTYTYGSQTEDAYQMIEFYDSNNSPLSLSAFSNSKFESQEVSLYVTGTSTEKSKDDFQIYIYRK